MTQPSNQNRSRSVDPECPTVALREFFYDKGHRRPRGDNTGLRRYSVNLSNQSTNDSQ